ELQSNFHLLGNTNSPKEFNFNGISISISEAKQAWKSTFSELFPYEVKGRKAKDKSDFVLQNIKPQNPKPKTQNAKPKAFIPAFPGTNSEYDSAKAFQKEGAETEIIVFKNLSEKNIEETVEAYSKAIDQAQIFFIPGGFSAADEPDGSGKFIATVLRNEKIRESVHRLLERDGLVLGICNGFQGLIKSGLLPYGEIRPLEEDTPTLTFNEIGRHISQLAKVKVNDSHSPWLNGMSGKEFWIPVSHGEGRFMANEANLKVLFEQNQIATQFIDLDGNIATEMPYNPNGSVLGIEGITSPCGKVFGRMGHPERYEEGLFQNIPDMEVMNIFKNGVKYFA